MDEKVILRNVSEAPDGEMLGTPPGSLRAAYAAAVEAGHLEVMRAPDATTVLGHRITEAGRSYLAGEAVHPAPQTEPSPASETAPSVPAAPPAPETPAEPTTTETPAQG